MGAPHPDKVKALFKNLKLIHLSAKLQQTNPLLVASVTGSIRKVKIRNDEAQQEKASEGPIDHFLLISLQQLFKQYQE